MNSNYEYEINSDLFEIKKLDNSLTCNRCEAVIYYHKYSKLKKTYCSTIGYEFMHMSDPDEKAWVRNRIEGPEKIISFTDNGKRAILNKIIEAEGFEKYLQVKFVGTKKILYLRKSLRLIVFGKKRVKFLDKNLFKNA